MVEDHPSSAPASGAVPRDAPAIGNGRYALVSKIAEGGMAGVYRAWDNKLRVWRAIKVLVPEFAQREVLRNRFEAEAKTMARLDHPHVIHVYDVGTREALPYMVMELAEGGTVNGWIDSYGKMPPRLAVEVVLQVARGLGAAHALGVVHRDVKPHNVLVTADGACKVTDFGIARVMDQENDGQTRTGATMGTIGYMAPEQRADAKLVDKRADIYAMGALLYKLVTGKVMTDLFLVEHEPGLLRNVPEPLHEIIVRSCYHDRDRRYADTDALMEALSELQDLLPDVPPETPALPIPLANPQRDYTTGFPEIAVLFSGRSRTPVPLPYTMSRPTGPRSLAPSNDRPAYVAEPPRTPPSLSPDRTDRTQPGSERPTPSSDASRKRSARPAEPEEPEVETDPSLHPVTVERQRRNPFASPWVGGLMLANVLLWGFTLLLTGWGVYDVRNRARDAQVARSEVYSTIDQERSLLPDFLSRGATRQEVLVLSALYDVYAASHDEPARISAATTYIAAVQAESARLGRGPSDLAMVRARNLERSWKRYATAHDRWVAASATPHGRLARWTGLARGEFDL